MRKGSAEKKFSELDDAMREYSIVFEKDLPQLLPKPKLSDFYTPTKDQHYRELTIIAVSMVCVGGLLYYVGRRRAVKNKKKIFPNIKL